MSLTLRWKFPIGWIRRTGKSPHHGLASGFRKRIETVFSQLNDTLMMIRNYAKQSCGLFTRMAAKIAAMTFMQYVNYANHRPIGKIKYSLI